MKVYRSNVHSFMSGCFILIFWFHIKCYFMHNLFQSGVTTFYFSFSFLKKFLPDHFISLSDILLRKCKLFDPHIWHLRSHLISLHCLICLELIISKIFTCISCVLARDISNMEVFSPLIINHSSCLEKTSFVLCLCHQDHFITHIISPCASGQNEILHCCVVGAY